VIKRDTAVRQVAKQVRAALEPFGFTGRGTTWILISEYGTASIGQWRSTNPDGVSPNVTLVGLNLAVMPAPYLEYRNWCEVGAGRAPKGPEESATSGLMLREYHGLPSYPQARLNPDRSALPYLSMLPGDVDRAGALLAARAEDYARRALHLLEPDNYLDELQADPGDAIGLWEPRVVLLADRGPSPELEAAIAGLYVSYRERGVDDVRIDRIAGYARQRAAGRI
jgi:hypothetical protein